MPFIGQPYHKHNSSIHQLQICQELLLQIFKWAKLLNLHVRYADIMYINMCGTQSELRCYFVEKIADMKLLIVWQVRNRRL